MVRFVPIPQFSIRTLLLITTACAVVFSIFGLGVRGNYWAAGVSIGIVTVVVALAVHAVFFAVIWTLAKGSVGVARQFQPGLSETASQPSTPIAIETEEEGPVGPDAGG